MPPLLVRHSWMMSKLLACYCPLMPLLLVSRSPLTALTLKCPYSRVALPLKHYFLRVPLPLRNLFPRMLLPLESPYTRVPLPLEFPFPRVRVLLLRPFPRVPLPLEFPFPRVRVLLLRPFPRVPLPLECPFPRVPLRLEFPFPPVPMLLEFPFPRVPLLLLHSFPPVPLRCLLRSPMLLCGRQMTLIPRRPDLLLFWCSRTQLSARWILVCTLRRHMPLPLSVAHWWARRTGGRPIVIQERIVLLPYQFLHLLAGPNWLLPSLQSIMTTWRSPHMSFGHSRMTPPYFSWERPATTWLISRHGSLLIFGRGPGMAIRIWASGILQWVCILFGARKGRSCQMAQFMNANRPGLKTQDPGRSYLREPRRGEAALIVTWLVHLRTVQMGFSCIVVIFSICLVSRVTGELYTSCCLS